MSTGRQLPPSPDDFEVSDPTGSFTRLDILVVPENFKPKNEFTFKEVRYVLFEDTVSGRQYLVDKKFVDLQGVECPEIDLFENILDSHLSRKYVIDLKKDPLEFSFPIKVKIKDTKLSEDFGQEVFELVELIHLNEFDILANPPVFTVSYQDVQGRQYTISDLKRMFESERISAEACSLLLLQYLINESFEEYINVVTSLNKEKSDFGICTDLEWVGVPEKDLPSKTIGNFYLITRLAKLARIYIESEKAKKDKRRVLVNPFDAEMYGHIENMTTVNAKSSVAKIEKFKNKGRVYDHLCHDSIAYANGNDLNVAVVDGSGGHAGAYFMSIVLSEYFAEGKSMLDPDQWAQFYKKKCELWRVLPKKSSAQPMAVYARAMVDPIHSMVELESLGDAYAVHFDSNFSLVQGLGGEFDDYDIYSRPEFVSPKNKVNFKKNAEIYLDRDNVPAGSVLQDAPKGSIALSSAPYKEGDFVLVMSDWVDKVFNVNAVKYILAPLYKTTSLYINRTDIARLDNLEGIKHSYYAANRLGTVSNRNQQIYLHMISLAPFIFLVKELYRLGVVSNHNELYAYLKEDMQSCLDDAGLALIFPQK